MAGRAETRWARLALAAGVVWALDDAFVHRERRSR
jgi:hypothetical protein